MATKKDFVINYGLQADQSGGTTNTLVVDSVNDRVGIGTGASTPGAKLDVNGDIIVSGGDISSGAAVNSTLFGTNTTGTIAIGGALTTGTLTLGSANGSGTIAIGNTGTAAAQAVNIATATTGTITIGGTGATAVQLPTGKTKVGATFLIQGGAVNITLPSSAGTLYASGNTDVALLDGGTNASLTAVNGGVVYSTATALAIGAAGTSGQLLVSKGAAAPVFETFELSLHAPHASYKSICRVATTADLETSSFASDVLTGYDDTTTLALTTTAASTTISTTSTATLKVGAVVSTATVQVAAGTTVASITSATQFTVNNRANITTTAITGNGTTATATFATQTYAPYAVGASIVITGATPTTYNGTKTVTACTTTTVQFASTETVTATVQGTIAFTIAAGTSINTNFAQTIAALVIDGVTLATNDRVLVKDSHTLGGLPVLDAAKYNGIYTVTNTGSTTVPWTLTRAADANIATDLDGAIVNVSQGTANFGKSYKTRFRGTDTLNTTEMYWGRVVDVNSCSYGILPVTKVGVDLSSDTETIKFKTGNLADLVTGLSLGIKTVQAFAASTYTNASTLYIEGAPLASTNATIIHAYALQVAAGNTLLAGNLTVSGGTITAGNVATALLGGNTTTNITIGAGLTTGTLTMGATGSTGAVSLFPATGAQNITLGGATTGTITIGGTGAAAVQLPTGKTKVGTSFLAQGSAFTYTFPTVTANDTLVGAGASQILTNKTLTAPRITSASHIADSNGNELIKFPTAVASAVNEITISNAITGAALGPIIEASGTDTDVSLTLKSKGTGSVNIGLDVNSNPIIYVIDGGVSINQTASFLLDINVGGSVATDDIVATSTGTGALSISAAGTDQNITLTPSGTGSVVISGPLNIASNKNITADFINATLINRTYFQSSTANSGTAVGAIPSGTGTSSAFYAFNNSTPTNAPYVGVTIDTTNAYLRSYAPGTGSALPLTIETQNRTAANSAAITLNTGTTTTSGTTGAVTIKTGNSAAVSGNLDISTGTGTTSGNITIDVGNGSTTDGTITIGGTNATSVTLPSGRTKIGNTTLTQGGTFTYTFPSVANGTLYASGNTDVALTDGGTNASLTAVNGGVVYSTASAMAITTAGTAGQALVSTGASAPSFQTLTLENLPDAWPKRAVKAATTADLGTLSATTTTTLTGPTGASAVVFPAQDGITISLNERLLVKNQNTAAQNGIYTLTTVGVAGTTAWVLTRAADADTSSELAGATVAVDQGTTQGGFTYDSDFKSTDTLGTTAVNFARVLDDSTLLTSTSASIGSVKYNGTTAAAGQFDGGTTTPTGTSRLNYGGYFYPTFLNLAGSADTATTATHYFVETGSDGFVRPKTLANVRTEIVTTAAVNAALPTALGTVVGLNLAAGTATVDPLTFTSGTNLTTAAAGAVEYDGSFFYMTKETTSGRGTVAIDHIFRLAANVTAFGPTIGDFYGANSSINLAASSVYEIEFYTYFTKTTAGTATWTITASSAPTLMTASYVGSPITGIAAGAPITGFTGSAAATTAVFGATGSLTTAVNHNHAITAVIITNLATNIRLRLTQSAGTATPLAGSYYRVTRVSETQGSYAA